MRSLPEEYIVYMITDMVYNSVSFPYLNFINMLRCENNTILIAPSYKDKVILLKAIIEYFKIYLSEYDIVNNLIPKIVEEYDKINMTYIQGYVHIPFNDILFFKTDIEELWHMYNINYLSETIVKIIKESYKMKVNLSKEIKDKIKIQMFIFASLYIDMDELLVYLYKQNIEE